MKLFPIIIAVPLSIGIGWTVVTQAQKGRPTAAKKSGEKTSEGEATRKPRKAVPAEPEVKPNDVSAFMRLKLEHSQKILEGVALEDFAMIKQHAQKLRALSLDENWQVLQTPEYRDHSRDFQQIADRLSNAAGDENLDGAALGYVQLTLNCVNCHKHVRDAGENRR